MIVDIFPAPCPERPYVIVPDRSHWPAGPDWCPGRNGGMGCYFPDLRAALDMPEIPHAMIRVYSRRWGFGRKIIFRVCPSCDYRDYEKPQRQKRRKYGWR